MVILLVILGGSAAHSLTQRPPRDLVVQYLAAIAAGDVAAANALAPDPVDREPGTPRGAGLGQPAEGSMVGAQLITNPWVSQASETSRVTMLSGESFTAEGFAVRFDIAGETYASKVWLERTAATWVSSEWRIRGSLADSGRVLVPAPLPLPVTVRVAGETITVQAPDTNLERPAAWEKPLYPGNYPVIVADSELITGDRVDLAITDHGGLVSISPFPKSTGEVPEVKVLPPAAVADAVSKLAAQQLTACTNTATGAEVNCGSRGKVGIIQPEGEAYRAALDGAAVVWSVAERPRAVRHDENPWMWRASAVLEVQVSAMPTQRIDVYDELTVSGASLDAFELWNSRGWTALPR